MDKKIIKTMRILGGIILALGFIGIGVSIFTAIKCLFVGIMAISIGLAILWTTEITFYKGDT